jgi:two-component system sensor histidine kinase KdpD
MAAAHWSYDHHQASGWRTDTLAAISWRFLPLNLEQERHGVLGIRLSELPAALTSAQLQLIETLTGQITLTLARAQLASSLAQARVAEETEQLRSALLSSVSHDLRTPLASMIGAASSLRELDTELSYSDKQELLDAVLSEGERLNRYIQNLLDMTRLGHGTLKIERDWIALEDLLAAALRRLREPLTGLQVIRDMPAGLPLLYVHPALIEQALVNVIENAARFSPAGGEIRIAAQLSGASLMIRISDQGPGIPAAERARVFDMFFTGQGGDRDRHGSGLGLAICHGMVGAHGGHIEALPGPDGNGTTIAIRLPLPDPLWQADGDPKLPDGKL